MPKQKIMKIGNSICVTVPAPFVWVVGVRQGEEVIVKTYPEKARVIYQFSGSRQLAFSNNLLKVKKSSHRKKYKSRTKVR